MEDNFEQNDFEEFLREQVRNHRMYPQDDVWQEINKKLHGEKKWPALTIAGLTLLTASIAICVYFTPKASIFDIKPSIEPIAASKPASQANDVLNKLTSSAPFTKEKSNVTPVLKPATPDLVYNSGNYLDNTGHSNKAPAEENEMSSLAHPESLKAPFVNHSYNLETIKQTISANTGSVNFDNNKKETDGQKVIVLSSSLPSNSIAPSAKKQLLSETSKSTKDYTDKNIVDVFLKEHQEDIAIHTTPKSRSLKNKFSYQIYVAPSVSYRSLVEDRSILKGDDNGPVGLNYVTDVNNVVRHKPGIGMEAGLTFMYNLSEKVRLKSGFQFNVRQYNIEAYRSNIELASIALVENNRIDTVNTLAVYRNSNGYYQTELVNRYYQVSLPLGIEWEVIGNSKIQFNIAASIQPTYLINRNAYLLSTNFKNYTERPEMVRNWNINSNIEAFISFKAGNYKWQLGPQLRYQPYSTFIPQYPIKEHLMDYGIKLGVSKIIN